MYLVCYDIDRALRALNWNWKQFCSTRLSQIQRSQAISNQHSAMARTKLGAQKAAAAKAAMKAKAARTPMKAMKAMKAKKGKKAAKATKETKMVETTIKVVSPRKSNHFHLVYQHAANKPCPKVDVWTINKDRVVQRLIEKEPKVYTFVMDAEWTAMHRSWADN